MSVLIALALGLMVCAYAGLFARRLAWHCTAGLLALSCFLATIDSARADATLSSGLFTATHGQLNPLLTYWV
ncbi:hypothetical protein AB0J01_41310 [Streptomyces sp. NPDC050204]|uniref:hypothetical protein n=1 Tax=Streptomyces sp. NPDC050204 TaxID=3155514 RepID=UPI00342126FF